MSAGGGKYLNFLAIAQKEVTHNAKYSRHLCFKIWNHETICRLDCGRAWG
ncbi:MAG: hypothetical protein LBP21_00725 [Synergistaceae bacterium]|nr:hypothetical protein [Synergistaceae bacterium]